MSDETISNTATEGTPEYGDATSTASIEAKEPSSEKAPDYKSEYESLKSKTALLMEAVERAKNGDKLARKAIENYIGIDSVVPKDPGAFLDILKKSGANLSEVLGGFIDEQVNKAIVPIKEREIKREVQTQYHQLTSKYPDCKEFGKQIVDCIAKTGCDLETAYKIVSYDKKMADAKRQGIEEYKHSIQEKKKADVLRQGSKTSQTSQSKPQKFKDFSDCFEWTKANL